MASWFLNLIFILFFLYLGFGEVKTCYLFEFVVWNCYSLQSLLIVALCMKKKPSQILFLRPKLCLKIVKFIVLLTPRASWFLNLNFILSFWYLGFGEVKTSRLNVLKAHIRVHHISSYRLSPLYKLSPSDKLTGSRTYRSFPPLNTKNHLRSWHPPSQAVFYT